MPINKGSEAARAWLKSLKIDTIYDPELSSKIDRKLNEQTKPRGSLGYLEALARQVALVQKALEPSLREALVIFAGDHGIAVEGVSAYPQSVTKEMVQNFLGGGAVASVLSSALRVPLLVVDSGVIGDFEPHDRLIDRKIAHGTKNFYLGPAMSEHQCYKALAHGAEVVDELFEKGINTLVLGEMGIANTSASSCLLTVLLGCSIQSVVGRGSGLNDAQLRHKADILEQAMLAYKGGADPINALGYFGGFEMVMMCAAFLRGAEHRMILMVDGFIATVAFLAAYELCPQIIDYAIFTHRSAEMAHDRILKALQVRPLLDLKLRLGEASGALLALPILRSAVTLFKDVATFSAAGVSSIENRIVQNEDQDHPTH